MFQEKQGNPKWEPWFVIAAVCAAVLVWGGLAAYRQWWTTDDAFISFRYARNLSEGLGLVFNAGERVEGYTNFLWTLWTAAGLSLGFEAEPWANVWGILFYLGSILLLLLNHSALRRQTDGTRYWLPVAALGAAVHRDWNIYATSGMETSMISFLLLAAFLLAVWKPSSTLWVTSAGVLSALAALTRPDGILPALVIGLFVLWFGRPRLKAALFYALSFAAIWLPFIFWRLHYYGDLFPNTYYAKSAYLPWYEQGLHYIVLYFEKYWALIFGPGLLLVYALIRRIRGTHHDGRGESQRLRQALLAAAIAGVYSFFIVRVGGDFMFARMLIPATPFYLLLLELGVMEIFQSRPLYGYCAALLLLAGMVVTPVPVTGTQWQHGISDERMYYTERRVAELDHSASVLGRYFEGLPVRVAIYGDEARIAYKARFPVAIESHAGLTEPEVARQKLEKRGRVGHEKHASAEYLIEKRKAHFTFSKVPEKLLGLKHLIPEVIVKFDDGVYGQVLHWDPKIMQALRRRGALIPDFIGSLDFYINRLDRMPVEEVARVFERFRMFYFAHVDDPARESAFRRRLGER